jgi:hypothetical protein
LLFPFHFNAKVSVDRFVEFVVETAVNFVEVPLNLDRVSEFVVPHQLSDSTQLMTALNLIYHLYRIRVLLTQTFIFKKAELHLSNNLVEPRRNLIFKFPVQLDANSESFLNKINLSIEIPDANKDLLMLVHSAQKWNQFLLCIFFPVLMEYESGKVH